ncbi:MAG TPA: DUF2254 domain-containing protein [Steroidobacteraceae bacterium]|jgi:uncharacterized membrane protein|nr:DUF2254 domain-containing protein [Steroidobacteraceae bacterium]
MSVRRRFKRLSGWSTPLIYVTFTIVVGVILPRLEHRYLPSWDSTISVNSAIAITSAIASGMIALTGIVFSLIFVMVQFSATAYSPRLVIWVARNPVMSHALGMFTSTFIYALFMLAWVDRESSGVVPLISGWLVFGLLLGSIAMFIALIDRVAMLQINRMLIFTGDQGRKAIQDLFARSERPASNWSELESSKVTQTVTFTGRPQVIQLIDLDELLRLAAEAGGIVEVAAAVGDTLLEGSPLVRVRDARKRVEEAALAKAFSLGDERTFEQDPKYALRLVVDIAIKALSPAINDPTTAVQALDQIEDLLLRLGRCNLDIDALRDEQGALRVLVPFPDWEDFLRLGLDEIRFYGGTSVQVMRRMNALIHNLLENLPSGRREALNYWAKRLQGTVQRSFSDSAEKQDASVADRQGLGIAEE